MIADRKASDCYGLGGSKDVSNVAMLEEFASVAFNLVFSDSSSFKMLNPAIGGQIGLLELPGVLHLNLEPRKSRQRHDERACRCELGN
jgi:hypothetical protein